MLAMVNSMLSTLVVCAQCQKQHLWALGPLGDPSHSPFSFKNRGCLFHILSLRRDVSQQPGQNHRPEKEQTPGELHNHSGHWP